MEWAVPQMFRYNTFCFFSNISVCSEINYWNFSFFFPHLFVGMNSGHKLAALNFSNVSASHVQCLFQIFIISKYFSLEYFFFTFCPIPILPSAC